MITAGVPGFSFVKEFSSLGKSVLWGAGIAAVALAGLAIAASRSSAHGKEAAGGSARAPAGGEPGRRLAVAVVGAALAINLGQWITWAAFRSSVFETTKTSLAAMVSGTA